MSDKPKSAEDYAAYLASWDIGRGAGATDTALITKTIQAAMSQAHAAGFEEAREMAAVEACSSCREGRELNGDGTHGKSPGPVWLCGGRRYRLLKPKASK